MPSNNFNGLTLAATFYRVTFSEDNNSCTIRNTRGFDDYKFNTPDATNWWVQPGVDVHTQENGDVLTIDLQQPNARASLLTFVRNNKGGIEDGKALYRQLGGQDSAAEMIHQAVMQAAASSGLNMDNIQVVNSAESLITAFNSMRNQRNNSPENRTFRYSSSIESSAGENVWTFTGANDQFSSNGWPVNLFPSSQVSISSDSKVLKVKLVSEADLKNVMVTLVEFRLHIKDFDVSYQQIQLLHNKMCAQLVMPLNAIFSVNLTLAAMSAIAVTTIDYLSSFLQPTATVAPMINMASSSSTPLVRMTNQERVDVIIAHPEFAAWQGKDEFLAKIANWKDPIELDLLENPINLKPTMNYGTYQLMLQTTGLNPQTQIQLDPNIGIDQALKIEIEQTLAHAENALRILTLQSIYKPF